ncbi:hypothetical protein GCM10010269_18810 [Streptomyces humidus]|uniref:Uncharacterized protein n=1 Tax=Streptomyces humidus TaxID=52259 RepID=A0A918FT70_9ACTN|nr:hypothetical protein GCM10010269_18810 [Streptomyces humidus]
MDPVDPEETGEAEGVGGESLMGPVSQPLPGRPHPDPRVTRAPVSGGSPGPDQGRAGTTPAEEPTRRCP